MSEDLDDKTQVLRRPPVAIVIKAVPALLNCVDTSVLKDGAGAQISLGDGEVSVGRDAENKVSLHAQGVSRYHARVYFEKGSWAVEDLGSTNGTRINNSKLEGKQSLNDGDTVAFGRACYKFQLIEERGDAGADTSIDIDLGANEQTMVMRPSQSPASSAKPKAPPARAASAANAVTAKKGDSGNAVLWLIVVAALAGLVFGAAKLLGFL
ncbi:MAG: putative component of type VI protein secretion system [Gammaproteobacteria bacterium]|jgi:predicted component of type VI protein secretion system